MPMTPAGLKSKIESEVGTAAVDGALLLKICKAIVEYIQQNAQVNVGIPVATTGGPSSQSGATTGPGTVS